MHTRFNDEHVARILKVFYIPVFLKRPYSLTNCYILKISTPHREHPLRLLSVGHIRIGREIF